LVALAIKLEDGGPVFFVQRRVGRGNRFFPIFKFRSMSVNRVGRDGTQSASKDDKRITRVGKIIRSTSIDELPQLLNVLRGDMSLVGPRPHATGSLAEEIVLGS
jgi:lipopolysaccharide/colanic/teichoic acid biosynthesis glycosyltransferase